MRHVQYQHCLVTDLSHELLKNVVALPGSLESGVVSCGYSERCHYVGVWHAFLFESFNFRVEFQDTQFAGVLLDQL